MPPLQGGPFARSSFIGRGASRLYVRDVGRGRPTVVLHGGPDFGHDYLLPDLDELADLFRLVYYDQRGRGRSFSGESPDGISMASEIDDLDRVRDWTGHASIALLGHSWGGLLALEYAIRRPDRVSHLILMNAAPASHAGMLAFRGALAASRSPGQIERIVALRSDSAYLRGDIAADAEYYRIHFSAALRRPEHLDKVVRQLRVGSSPEGIVAARAIEDTLYAQTWSADDYDLLPGLRSLRIPTLLIHGQHDLIPLDIARRIADAIPGSRLVVLADCGHFAYMEQPDRVRAVIAEFLAPP